MLFLARLLIRGYQILLSPALHFLAGPGGGCRFEPSCSVYFLQALETHGFFRGTWLGLCRLGRCNPWGSRGPDPVPPRKWRKFVTCEREAAGKLKTYPTIVCE